MLGKILSTRSFIRFTINEIIAKTWNTKTKVLSERLDENIFKFSFGNKEDMDSMYRSRPWCLNGAHWILREWPSELALNNIKFDTSTFYIQIHGLPLMYLHERIAQMIDRKVGFIHPSSINRRCVVVRRFLHFRLEIEVRKPLPMGFLLERNNGNDIWV